MSRPLPPTITVRSGGWQRTFAPGRDVVIGRDVRADVRLAHPAVSRAHVMLRCLDGNWVAVDNQSFNGMFVGSQRVSSVDIRDEATIHLGDPDGPRLTFELGRVAQPDGTDASSAAPPASAPGGGAPPRLSQRGRPPSAAAPTTTSSFRTCWPRSATQP